MPISTLRKTALRTGIGCLGLSLLTFILFQLHVDLASAIPLYMLVVVVHSMMGDFPSAAIISVLSAACLDFFFTQPLFSLYMANSLNVIALVSFLAIALVVTRLVSDETKQAKAVLMQKDRLDSLYEVSQHLLALEPDAMMTDKFFEPFRSLFDMTAICAFDAETAEVHVLGSPTTKLQEKTREAYISGHDLNDPASRMSVICLRGSAGGKMTGAIGFEGLKDPEQTTASLALLTAAVVQRNKAFHQATDAAAAAQAEVYRSAVLDALAHEFKTPLATILAAAGGIRETGHLTVEQQDLADTIESEAVRLNSLTSRLLRTAHLDRDDVKPRMGSMDLGALVQEIARQCSQRFPDRCIVVDTPEASIELFADAQLLRIAVAQLVENACKYSVPGSAVNIAIAGLHEAVAVKVTNTGSSIPYGERSRIFERFYRGENVSRTTAGSGLGLYVARKIAIAHSGSLDLDVEEKQGGTVAFTLTLPRHTTTEDHVSAA